MAAWPVGTGCVHHCYPTEVKIDPISVPGEKLGAEATEEAELNVKGCGVLSGNRQGFA